MNKRWSILATSALAVLALAGCAATEPSTFDETKLTIYSGREEDLVEPLVEAFEASSGIDVEVRYAGSAELAAQILEEGAGSPADLFFSQDAGALGALSKAGALAQLPQDLLERVDTAYRSSANDWVGATGRSRVLVYNPSLVTELPGNVLDLAGPEWRGRIAIAPGNASFQSFVTALRLLEGEQVAADWLVAMKANALTYEKNNAILEAVESGEVAAGLINHYYWHILAAEKGEDAMMSKLASFEAGDAGNLINVSGVGLLSANPAALEFARYLLSDDGQTALAKGETEYPLVAGIPLPGNLVPIAELPAPAIDLGDLDTLEQTLEMIRAAGLL